MYVREHALHRVSVRLRVLFDRHEEAGDARVVRIARALVPAPSFNDVGTLAALPLLHRVVEPKVRCGVELAAIATPYRIRAVDYRAATSC